jgi:SAM-dependent methyltransferase
MWGSAPFERIAELAADIHDDLVARLAPRPGETFLDVACGTGGISERAARAGAVVTGVDFAPVLVETARRRAGEFGLAIRYDVGDAERLPYEDGSFDVVASSFGVMFAPDQRAAAGELARVCRRGGRLGLACWTADGGIGDLFRMLAPFQPPPPEGVPSPFEWGRPDAVRALLGEAFDLEFVERESPQVAESGEAIWRLFSTSFGPTKTLAESLDPERREELHRAYVEFYEGYRDDGGIRHPRHYLITLGTRR